jgi:hypothetical protein
MISKSNLEWEMQYIPVEFSALDWFQCGEGVSWNNTGSVLLSDLLRHVISRAGHVTSAIDVESRWENACSLILPHLGQTQNGLPLYGRRIGQTSLQEISWLNLVNARILRDWSNSDLFIWARRDGAVPLILGDVLSVKGPDGEIDFHELRVTVSTAFEYLNTEKQNPLTLTAKRPRNWKIERIVVALRMTFPAGRPVNQPTKTTRRQIEPCLNGLAFDNKTLRSAMDRIWPRH